MPTNYGNYFLSFCHSNKLQNKKQLQDLNIFKRRNGMIIMAITSKLSLFEYNTCDGIAFIFLQIVTSWFIQHSRWNCFYFLANFRFLIQATLMMELVLFPCILSLLDSCNTHDEIAFISLQITTSWLMQHSWWNCFYLLANYHFLTHATLMMKLLLFPCKLPLLDSCNTHDEIAFIFLQIATSSLLQHSWWNCFYFFAELRRHWNIAYDGME